MFVAKTNLPGTVFDSFRPFLQTSTWRLFTVGAMYIAVVSFAAMVVSHRAVGPIKRLEEEIRRHADTSPEGKLLTVREGDELEDVVHAMNRWIRKVEQGK